MNTSNHQVTLRKRIKVPAVVILSVALVVQNVSTAVNQVTSPRIAPNQLPHPVFYVVDEVISVVAVLKKFVTIVIEWGTCPGIVLNLENVVLMRVIIVIDVRCQAIYKKIAH
jgi:hypothetical protein